jgi:hypothetical protein
VVTGVQGAGDFVYVHYVDKGQISLGVDHWGHPGIRTTWLPIDYAVDHVVEIQMGALLPPSGNSAPLKGRVHLMFDGEVVLDADQPTYESSPADVLIGKNSIGGSTCSYEFSGEIKSVKRLPLPVAAAR